MNHNYQLSYPNCNYVSPPQQTTASWLASQQAKKAADIAATLQQKGRNTTSSGTTHYSWSIDNTYIPMAYTSDNSGWDALQYSMYLQFNAADYSHVYETADDIFKQYTTPGITAEQTQLLHIYAINQAIAEQIRPDQATAEWANSALVAAKHEAWEVVIDSKEAKNRATEVCVHKSAIAKHYLDTQWIISSINIDPEDSHMFLMLWSQAFHPNSPIQTTDGYIPHVETMTAEQQVFFTRLQQNDNNKKTGRVVQFDPHHMQ